VLRALAVLVAFMTIPQIPVQLPPGTPDDAATRIHFDLAVFDAQGLFGPPDGLRAAAYEFCIPASPETIAEFRAIDPTVQILPGSPGRIGCTADQYLCIGSTHQPGFRSVLVNLAQLEYVTHIELSVAE